MEGRPLDDATLVEQARKGNIHAYENLVERYTEVAFRTAYLVAGSAADVVVQGQTVRIYGAVMGQPGQLPGAFAATTRLVRAAAGSLHSRVLTTTRDIVADYRTAWGSRAQVAPAHDVSLVLYDGTEVHRSVQVREVTAPLASGSAVGSLVLLVGDQRFSVPLRTNQSITEPDIWWRLFRTSPS